MTGPVLEVDIDALNADGRRLESLGDPLTPSNCAPPGSDPVSLGAARALNAHESALIEVLNYATLVRQYGGVVVRSAAVAFERADRAGAESIRRVDDSDAPPIASSSGPLQMPALPPMPHQPSIASVPELPALPSIGGEQFSAYLHSGPGSGDLRDFSRAWHNYSRDIIQTADDTAAVFVSVSEHWSSGDKAAGNISKHATWLESAARWAERLSVAAEAVAHGFDIAKQNTPTPDEFEAADSDVMKAALVAEAEEAAERYHASVSGALTRLGDPIAPCPPIASQAPSIPVPSDEGPQLGPGVKLAEETPLTTTRAQIEAKFKHAQDFGVTEPRGKAGFDAYEESVSEQVKDPATMHIAGTYRGNPAILNYNPSTGTVVVQSPTGEFISAWRVSQAQATNIVNHGKLGGG